MIRQIIRHIGREKWLFLGSVLVLAILFLLVDLFWIASLSLEARYRQVISTVAMETYLDDAVPEGNLAALEMALKTLPNAASVAFVSKAEAAGILESDLGEGVMDVLEENPLPRSFVLRFDRPMTLAALDDCAARIKALAGVDAVEFGRPWIEKMERLGRNLHQAMYLLGGLIIFVVLLTLASTNRLSAKGKAPDFFQLKLLGAGPSYLIIPFMAEGFLSGLLAALLSWGAIFYFAGNITIAAFTLELPSPGEISIYVLAAGLVAMIGAYLGIRKYVVA
ncbi:MAG: permease-like cell division protein FtsX [candidate division Zixibacteria bacterium]|nr:permease-like cell division protein FtsX [candidate division Zixibacteria bacterium]